MASFDIDGRSIGEPHAPFIIAEISGNHGGDFDAAITLIDVAREAGADAVKFQTYTPDTITLRSDAPEFQVGNDLWSGQTLYELYQQAQTPFDWHEALFAHARKIGITPLSSPFDQSAIDLLKSLDAPAYKIASHELVDVNLIAAVARTGKPMILSTGMAREHEIAEALEVARNAGARDICLLHCISGYPTPVADANLATLAALRHKFGVLVGLSDHTLGTDVAVAAVALGASIIEKHICLSRDAGPVDGAFSLEPAELGDLVEAVHNAHSALGRPIFEPLASEADSLRFRRSLFIVKDIAAGDRLTPQSVRSVRPANGLHPRHLNEVLGQAATRALKTGEPLDWSMINAQEK